MPDAKVDELPDGDPAEADDQLYANRGGVDRRISAGSVAALASGGGAAFLYLTQPFTFFAGAFTGDTTLEQAYITDVSFATYSFANCASLTRLALQNMQGGTSVDLTGCVALAYVDIGNNTALDTITPPATNVILEFYAIDCALLVASVNAILVALDGNGLSNGTVDLSGGSSAAPTGAGAAAVTSLQGKGWTVTVNP